MSKLTKNTYETIKKTVVKICDNHNKSIDNAWGSSDKAIGRMLVLQDIEDGRTDQFNIHYFYHPIKGNIRVNVRREYGEIAFFYHTPFHLQRGQARPMDIFYLFTDAVIAHRIQESKSHLSKSGMPAFIKSVDDLSEEEGQELFGRLSEIIIEEDKKGLINNSVL